MGKFWKNFCPTKENPSQKERINKHNKIFEIVDSRSIEKQNNILQINVLQILRQKSYQQTSNVI